MIAVPEARHLIARAIKALGITKKELAKRLGLNSPQHLWDMERPGRPLSPKRVIPFEQVAGISRHESRPDLYPIEK